MQRAASRQRNKHDAVREEVCFCVFECICVCVCVHLLKVAEGGVALDVVLLLEAVKLARMHVHPRQHLEGGGEVERDQP